MKEDFLLIVNPKSGKGRHERQIAQVKKYFTKHHMTLEIIYTQYQGHARELAAQAVKENRKVVIGAGGDGTINEIVNGLAQSNTAMAILPWGTGNVFAREMNIPLTTSKACKVIRKNNQLRMDLGHVKDRFFLLMCSAGFDAYSVKKVENFQLKNVFGKLSYLFAGIQAFIRYRHPPIMIRLEDGTEDVGGFVLVSNTSRYGVYFTPSPYANPVDGMLDIFLFKETGGWSIFRLFLRFALTAFRKHAKGERPRFFTREATYRTRSVQIWSDESTPTQIDGDIFDPLPLEISVQSEAINVILPKKIALKHRKRAEKLKKKQLKKQHNPK